MDNGKTVGELIRAIEEIGGRPENGKYHTELKQILYIIQSYVQLISRLNLAVKEDSRPPSKAGVLLG